MKIFIEYKIVNKGEMSGSAYYLVHNSLGETLRFKNPPIEYDIKKALSSRLLDKVELSVTKEDIEKSSVVYFPLNMNYPAAYGLMHGFLKGMSHQMGVLDKADAKPERKMDYWNFAKQQLDKILDDLKNNKNYKV